MLNLVGSSIASNQFDATYTYCPTGNLADPPVGAVPLEFANLYREYGWLYDWRSATYWTADGIQVDANSDNQRTVPSLPVIFNPQVYQFLASLRTPDYYTYSTSYTPPKTSPLTPNIVSGVFQEVVDRYGQAYVGFGSSVGPPGSGFSFTRTAGYILQAAVPSSADLSNFITGRSVTVSGGIEGAGAVTWGLPGQMTPNAFALEAGASSSLQAGVTFISDTIPIP